MQIKIILTVLLIFLSVSFALTEIDSCQTLNTAGETYILNTSFSGSGGCLVVNATGIVINGNGSTITGTGTTTPVIQDNGTFGYTIGNITIAGSHHAFGIGATSNFSNIIMRDVNSTDNSATSYISMISDTTPTSAPWGIFPVVGDNLSMINITRAQTSSTSNFGSTIGLIACQKVGGSLAASNCTSNIQNTILSNINFLNVSALNNASRGQTAVGVYSVVTWSTPGDYQQINISNSSFDNITFNNVSVNVLRGSLEMGENLGVIAIDLDAILSGANSQIIIDYTNITNVNFTSSSMHSDSTSPPCYGIISTCDGSQTANTQTTVTNSILSLNQNNTSITGLGVSTALISTARLTAQNITATSVPFPIYYTLSGSSPLTNISNFSVTSPLTLGLNTIIKIDNFTSTSNGNTIFDIRDIASVPSDPTGTRNVSAYINYSATDSNIAFSLFYIPPPAPWLEQDIKTQNLSGSNWNIVNTGTIDQTNNFIQYTNLSVLGTTKTIGLFVNDPTFSISLNAPANNQYFNVSTVLFNWTTTGELSLYLSNLTIDGVANTTAISTTNNSLTSQSVSGFVDGSHNWSVISYNSTVTNTSTTRFFTVDTIPPAITLNSPANATLTNSTLINFNFTQTDSLSPTSNCSIFIDTILTSTNTTTNNATVTIFPVSMSNGAHNWSISCTDLAGNNNISETRLITINSVAPIINLESPSNGQTLIPGFVSFSFNTTSTLSPSMSCSLFVDSSAVQTNSSVQNGTSTSFSQNVPTQANHNWQVQCTDTFGNLAGSTIQNFTILQSGGGGGGSPTPPILGNTTTITPPTTPTPPAAPTINPPPQSSGISQAVDTVVQITNGNVQAIPFTCNPYWQTNFNFIGAKFADTLACEYKGILSLYVQKVGSFPNLAMILILFLIYLGTKQEKTSIAFYGIVATIIITVVIGADLITYSLTAIFLQGKKFFG